MLDAYIRAISADDLSALDDALGLLEAEIDHVPGSLVWPDLRAMAARRPGRVIATLAELVQASALDGACLYVEGLPAAVCFWGADPDAPDAPPSVVCLFVAERYEKRGLDQWLLAEIDLARAPPRIGRTGRGGAARNVRA